MSKSTELKLPEKLRHFFQNNAEAKQLEKNKDLKIVVFRSDGVVLYGPGQLELSSIGALMGGVWQAAKALSEFIPKNDSHEGYRLSFDTSNKGIYILPMTLKSNDYLMGAIYSNQINPALVKNKLRTLTNGMLEHLQDVADVESANKKEDFLFNNISDDEIDNLFSFMGH